MISFDDLGLDASLLDAVRDRGFETPTPIQAEMIPFLLEQTRDVTGLAQTGTGKTAAFGLPILQKINRTENRTQALILAPTRELGMQVSREIADYGRKLPGLKTATVYGGAPFGPQIRDLRAGAHIVTATPGRLRDLLDKDVADLASLRYLVLDEADQMLDMGFKDDLDAILQAAGSDRQTLLFSATMPPEVARIASNYMTDPHEIVAGERNQGAANVIHLFYFVHSGEKYAALRRLIDIQSGMYAIVFCRTRETARNLAAKLARDGYAADALHGELSQSQREAVMTRFRRGNPSILAATDVAARGLDVDNLSHVIHYDLPEDLAVYNHRSGRTGRAGRSGTSLALVHPKEGNRIRRIERVLGRKIEADLIPGGSDVCRKRLADFAERVNAADPSDPAIEPYLDSLRDKFNGLEREDLLRRFVSLEFNPYLAEYANAPDLNPPPPPKRSRREAERLSSGGGSGRKGGPTGPMVRLRINLGRRQSVLPAQLISLVGQASRSKNVRLGKINISTDWSDIQVEASAADRVEAALRGFSYSGTRIRVERGREGRPPHLHAPKDRRGGRRDGKKKGHR